MTARLVGTLLLACAGAGLGLCGAVRRQGTETRIRLLARLWTYLEELLVCRALTGPMLLRAAAENPAFAPLALPQDCTLSALPLPALPKALAGELRASLAALGGKRPRRCLCRAAPYGRTLPPGSRPPGRTHRPCHGAVAPPWRLCRAAAGHPFVVKKMDIDLVFKIAATGIIVAVLNQLLIRSGREDQAMMTTLAGLIVVLSMLVRQISDLFVLIKALFEL